MKNIILSLLITTAFSVSLCDAPAPSPVGFLFAHGFGGTEQQMNWYKRGNSLNWHIMGEPCSSFNFPEVLGPGKVDNRKVNLAQKGDIAALRKAHEALCAHPTHPVESAVVVAVSRGASTAITYAATKPKKLKALVLEAPFDTVENVIYYLLRRNLIGYIPGFSSLAYTIICSVFPNHKERGPHPLRAITDIDKDLPILFIHSRQDGFIAFENCQALYKKLKRRGYKHVHFLELTTGRHARYQWESEGLKYQATVHAFYQKYDIPHDKELAEKGKQFLK
jgi:hypothetical protein